MPYNVTLTAADAAAVAAGASVAINVSGPAATPPPPPPPPTGLTVVIAQNGVLNPAWTQDYDYNAKDAEIAQGTDSDGNPEAIVVTTTGPWGGYQPSNLPGQTTDFSACGRLTVTIKAPKGNSYSMQYLMGGDKPINAPGFQFTKTTNGWETFSCAKAQCMTDAVLGDVSKIIYKGAIQSKQSAAGDVYEVDNWGGV